MTDSNLGPTQFCCFRLPVQATEITSNSGASPDINLGCARMEFERMRPFADCELEFSLTDGSKGNEPCHKALLAQVSNVLRCVANDTALAIRMSLRHQSSN